MLGVQLRHEVVHGILCLPKTKRWEREEAKLDREGQTHRETAVTLRTSPTLQVLLLDPREWCD